MLTIKPARPDDPQVKSLLMDSHALMHSLFPPEGCHCLDLKSLSAPNIHLFAAWETVSTDDAHGGHNNTPPSPKATAPKATAAKVRAIGALRADKGYGELKSMFTAPPARGQGIARTMINTLEAHARTLHIPHLYLETGHGLDAALHLYHTCGFQTCGPFGSYSASPYSIFMHKVL